MSVEYLVFIHGWASKPEIWQGQGDYFSRNYKVIFPDISAAKDIKESANIVNSCLKAAYNIVLIGWSLGWLVALELLKSSPLSPKGLICVNSTPKFIDDGYLGIGPTKTHLAKIVRDCKRSPQKALEDFYRDMLSDDGYKMFSGLNFKNFSQSNLISGLEMLKASDYREFIKTINVPVLIITGEKDAICPPEASLYMHKEIGGSKLKVLDCGHATFLVRQEEFNRLAGNFIQSLK